MCQEIKRLGGGNPDHVTQHFSPQHSPLKWPENVEQEAREVIGFYAFFLDNTNTNGLKPFLFESTDSDELFVISSLPTRVAADGRPVLHMEFSTTRDDDVKQVLISGKAVRFLCDMLERNRQGEFQVPPNSSYILPFGSDSIITAMHDELLLAMLMIYSKDGKKCGRCGAAARFACNACEMIAYCGKSCQRMDWKYGPHKRVCSKRSASLPTMLACSVQVEHRYTLAEYEVHRR